MTVINGIDYGQFDDARDHVCNMIDAHRGGILYNKFIWNNLRWDCDDVSRQNLTGACTFVTMNGGNTPPGFVWRDYDNNDWPMSGLQMAEIAAALLTFTFTCYQVAWFHKGNVKAITDPNRILDVLNYDFSGGWPSTSMSFAIVETASHQFQVAGNVASMLTTTPFFTVTGSTGNNGAYTVVNASYDGTNTSVTTVEPVLSNVVDGKLVIE